MTDQSSLVTASAAHPQSASIENVMRLVNSIDLRMVKLKIMDEEEGQGWDQDQADYVERRYRRYLCMVYMTGNGSVVPTKDIDLFWHQHILDTRAYARDCQSLFGEFRHHFPYFGMRGEDDAKNLQNAFEETAATYANLFGEDYSSSDSSRCHKCSSTCHKCSSNPNCSDTIKCTRCSNHVM